MLLATALALLLQDVLNRRLLFKTNRQQWHQRKPSPIISSFLELGRKKTVDAAKFVAAQKMLVETQQTFVNGLLRFYYFRHLYSAGARVYCSPIIA